MDIGEVIERAREGMAARRVYGEPYEKEGIAVVPAAAVMGRAGGGSGETTEEAKKGEGTGAGFSLKARPVGAFIIEGGRVRWQSAPDWTRIILGLQGLLAVGLVLAFAWPGRRARRR